MKRFLLILISFAILISCQNKQKTMENKAKELIQNFEERFIPVFIEYNKAYFNATISGKDEDYKKAEEYQLQMSKVLSDKELFKKVKELKEYNLKNYLLKRQIEVLYNNMLRYQIDSILLDSIIKAEIALEQKFNTFRATIDGKTITDNEIEETLKNSTNSEELKKVWLASKQVGEAVASDIINLVKLRNKAAKSLGFSNYHEMMLNVTEQDPEQILQLIDKLDSITSESFAKVKDEMDDYLSKRLKIKKDELMPWHYQNRFFQEAPAIYDIDLDKYFKNKDILKIVTDYYSSIGFDVTKILERSDLFEKPGKNQHAYCTSIDRSGDVRILANVKNNYNWTSTMLHELGHAIYEIGIDTNLPFLLREPAHIFTTEAIANYFGLMASNPQWLIKNLGVNEDEINKVKDNVFKNARLEKLVFSRWSQVMYRFEKSMYENPDQDLNNLWWTLVEKYQLLKKPENRNKPDWAAKIHIATVPCYYHNYLLGDLLAAQIDSYIQSHYSKSSNGDITGNIEAGKYLKEKIFQPGLLYKWNDMIKQATGEELNPIYYVKKFVENKF